MKEFDAITMDGTVVGANRDLLTVELDSGAVLKARNLRPNVQEQNPRVHRRQSARRNDAV